MKSLIVLAFAMAFLIAQKSHAQILLKSSYLFNTTKTTVHDKTFDSKSDVVGIRGGEVILYEDSLQLTLDEYYDTVNGTLLPKFSHTYSILFYRNLMEDGEIVRVDVYLDDGSVFTVKDDESFSMTEFSSFVSDEKEYRYKITTRFFNLKKL